ncbi:MAG TPA: SAM-dependent methyltransferase [Actinomycetes bacterium]
MWTTWRAATERALYGDNGFYRRPGAGPAAHFRTSVHASPLFARAVLSLARTCGLDTVVDVGAGRGELLTELHRLDPTLGAIGVEVAGRPAELAGAVGWTSALPDVTGALVVANEWLDNIPVDLVEQTADGPRVVEVDPAGVERLGGPPEDADRRWLERWWPLTEVGARAEVGRPRDEAWATVVASVRRGVAVAVDYSHDRASRPPAGSFAAYRLGRQVPPVPDGSCDLTAHVALDACAAAGLAAGATSTALTTQRVALRALGQEVPVPSREMAESDPAGYLTGLAAAGEVAELTARDGLGGFGWLVQGVGVPPPPGLAALSR